VVYGKKDQHKMKIIMDTETALQLTVKQQAAEIMNKPDIQQRVKALIAQREQATQATAEYVSAGLKEVVERAVDAKQYGVALKGLELIGNHHTLFTHNRTYNRKPITGDLGWGVEL